jgi:hypothetical protein
VGVDTPKDGPFGLVSYRLGALPVINHFLDRIGLDAALDRWLPEPDRRFKLTPATAIRLLVINLLAGRAPLYGLAEWAAPYAPHLLRLPGGDTTWLNDDRVGRALVALFDADRASLLTDLIVGMIGEFGVDTCEMHNDSTSVSVHGQYETADGSPRRGKPTAAVTFGHSKDHRPDLKQLVWILTVSADGSVPMAYRLADGNTCDDPTHIPTWNALVKVLNRHDFLYVADSKLCSGDAMRHIDSNQGRFVTVLPRTRGEDKWFRDWIQTSQPQWTEAIRLPGQRLGDLPRIWSTFPSPLPSAEGYRIVWVHSTTKAARDTHARRSRLEAGTSALEELNTRLAGPKTRLKRCPRLPATPRPHRDAHLDRRQCHAQSHPRGRRTTQGPGVVVMCPVGGDLVVRSGRCWKRRCGHAGRRERGWCWLVRRPASGEAEGPDRGWGW